MRGVIIAYVQNTTTRRGMKREAERERFQTALGSACPSLMTDCPHRLADGEVRRTAVKWLSGLRDDDLCDFLPQLVQSLRHDCFEACPMASLLLSRAVRSPRIAHHLYWWVWSLNTVLCILYVVLLVGVASSLIKMLFYLPGNCVS